MGLVNSLSSFGTIVKRRFILITTKVIRLYVLYNYFLKLHGSWSCISPNLRLYINDCAWLNGKYRNITNPSSPVCSRTSLTFNSEKHFSHPATSFTHLLFNGEESSGSNDANPRHPGHEYPLVRGFETNG